MRILDRLPIARDHFQVDVLGKPVRLRPYQILIYVSVSPGPEWDPRTPIFPALIDTGNNLNFSIQEDHLYRWAGIHPRFLALPKVVREAGRRPALRDGTVWIHRNVPGSRESKTAPPLMLSFEEGIAVYPSDQSDYPRLPLLGFRAILKNKLKFAVDGPREHASLRTPLW